GRIGLARQGGAVRRRGGSRRGLPLGGRDDGSWTARVAASATEAGRGRAGDQAATEDRTGGVAVRFRKGGAVESGDEPLPLDDADSNARRARFDESGTSRGRLPVRTGARTQNGVCENCAREKRRDFGHVERAGAPD